MTEPGLPATIVLVHGAHHGAWCWDPVKDELNQRGIPILAVNRWTKEEPCLVVRDAMENHRIIRAALDQAQVPIVLVGHSSAGRHITSAGAGHPNVRHLVYLAANMSGGEVEFSGGTNELAEARVAHEDGSVSIDPTAACDLFYGDCEPSVVEWAISQLRPDAPGDTRRSVDNEVAWHSIPSTYVICARDRAMDPYLQRRYAAQATEVVEWDTSHSPFLSRPYLVADLLEQLARRHGC